MIVAPQEDFGSPFFVPIILGFISPLATARVLVLIQAAALRAAATSTRAVNGTAQ